MNASNFLEEAMINHFFRNGNVPSPAQLFLTLYISDPTDSDTGTEVSGASYVRQQVSFTAPTQQSGKGTSNNTMEIRFPIATTVWGTITHFGIRNAQTGGNLLAHAAVPIPKLIEIGDEAKFSVNALTLTID